MVVKTGQYPTDRAKVTSNKNVVLLNDAKNIMDTSYVK